MRTEVNYPADDTNGRPTAAEVDLNRVIWDAEYRRRVLERLKRDEAANENDPPDGSTERD